MVRVFFMEYLFLFLLLITGLIYDSAVADIIGPQWLYLATVNILIFIFNLYKKNFNQIFHIDFKRLTIVYILFVIISIFSSLNALSWTLSILEIARQSIFISAILNIYFLFKKFTIDQNFYIKISRIFLIIFFIEISDILIGYIKNFETIRPRDYVFSGFSTNINIGGLSLLLKTPFLLFLFFYDNLFNKWASIVCLTLFSYFLFWTQSRAIFLSISFIFLLYLFIVLNNKSKYLLKIIIYGSIIFTLNFIVSSYLIKRNSISNTSIVSRLKSPIENDDESLNLRLQYWKGGIKQIIKSPILGVGIGNWKLNSLEYDSTYMNGYQVQYHMHNDFLQVFAELGIFGFLLFICFLVLIVISLFKNLNKNQDLFYTLFFIAIIGYLVDLLFNFPHERSEIQSIFAVIVALVFLKEKSNE